MKNTWNLSNYQKIWDMVYLKILIKSVLLSLLATLICFVIGLIFSLYLMSVSPFWKFLLLFLVSLPFWTNTLIRTYSLIAIFRKKGYVNLLLEKVWIYLDGFFSYFNYSLGEFTAWEILYSDTGVLIGLVYVYLPFMIFPLFVSLDKMDKSIIEASFDLGAGYFTTLKKVILPNNRTAIRNGFIITFIPALGSFLIPDLLGGKDSSMIANIIERQFKGANDWPLGSALSLLLIYITIVVIFITSIARKRFKKAQKS